MFLKSLVQGKYEKKKEAVSEEMEVEASKMEKDVEEDFGVSNRNGGGQLRWW